MPKKKSAAASQAALNSRANQLNPNHTSYKASRQHQEATGRPTTSASAPKQRGHPGTGKVTPGEFQQIAQKCQEQRRGASAVGDVVPRIEKVVRQVLGSNTHLVKQGSAAKGTGTRDSDRDYLLFTPDPVTRNQIKQLVRELENDKTLQGRYSSIRKKTNAITLTAVGNNPDIDIVPQRVAHSARRPDFQQDKCVKVPEREIRQLDSQLAAAFLRESDISHPVAGFQIDNAVVKAAKECPRSTAQDRARRVLSDPLKYFDLQPVSGGKSVEKQKRHLVQGCNKVLKQREFS